MNGPEVALTVCGFLYDTATMLLWGSCSFSAGLLPRDLGRALEPGLRRFRIGAVAVAVVSALTRLPIEIAVIGGGWSDVLDLATARAVLLDTSVGHACRVAAVTAVLLAVSLTAPRRMRPGAIAIVSGLLLAELALTGHAVMHAGGLGIVHRLNDAVHLLAGGAWLGALIPLRLTVDALDRPATRRDAAIGLRRFSAAGHCVVALLIVTGVVNTLLVLGRWPTDWSSGYQAMLAAKILIAVAMVALALVNRYGIVPRLAEPATHRSSLAVIGRIAVAELVLGGVVVGLVAVFGRLEPT